MSKQLMNRSKQWWDIAEAVGLLCNQYRFGADRERGFEYVLVMFFWKYISDVWKEEYEKSKTATSVTQSRLKLAKTRFYLLPGSSFYDVLEQCGSPYLGAYINQAFEKISIANGQYLSGIFDKFDFATGESDDLKYENSRFLSNLMKGFCLPALDLRPSQTSDIDLGEIFSFLISRNYSNSGRSTSEFYTNDEYASLLAKLLSPSEDDTICDPVCGTGSLLIRAFEETPLRNCKIFGQERDSTVHAIARLNMLFHGIYDAKIYKNDSIMFSSFVKDDKIQEFDRVIASLTTGRLNLGKQPIASFVDNPINREFPGGRILPDSIGFVAILDMLIRMTKPREGKLTVVVPSALLFRGHQDLRLRRLLIEENILDAVISVPSQRAFGSSTAAIFVIDRTREKGGDRENYNDVIFIDAIATFEEYQNSNLLDYSHIEKVISVYRNRLNKENFSFIANTRTVEDNNFDLTVSKYIQTAQIDLNQSIRTEMQTVQELEGKIRKLNQRICDSLEDLEAEKGGDWRL